MHPWLVSLLCKRVSPQCYCMQVASLASSPNLRLPLVFPSTVAADHFTVGVEISLSSPRTRVLKEEGWQREGLTIARQPAQRPSLRGRLPARWTMAQQRNSMAARLQSPQARPAQGPISHYPDSAVPTARAALGTG
ncbi:hypothetical protein GGR56DRAFT_231014 [Xylariaceae sp. FL0804]|nr:hypothetical protein GGR56DRAFT_231014 [Xylariaceae sp. FL0804]